MKSFSDMRTSMGNIKPFSERNPVLLGISGVLGIAVIGYLVLQVGFGKLPPTRGTTYSGYFEDAGGLFPHAIVEVSGFPVGKVDDIELAGPGVLVKFNIKGHIHLGDRTTAAIKTKGLLGTKNLDVIPAGEGRLTGPIPLSRTASPYQLPDALGDLTAKISGVDTAQLSDSLATLAEAFSNAGPNLKKAVNGVSRFTEVIDQRDAQLRRLLDNANKATTVLAKRTDNIVSLVKDSNALFAQLNTENAALDQLSDNLYALYKQVGGLIEENKTTLRPALDKLNGVLGIVDKRKHSIQQVIKEFGDYAVGLGESVSDGPFFNAYVSNVLPGQYMQPFVDVAFRDLGLDPATLAPSELNDPQVGQPGTPPLPLPYPRTGQGGPPRTSIPDAITGNADPDFPQRTPGRYPLRQEPPPSPRGSTETGPPGLPVPGPSGPPTEDHPSPGRIYVPAPGEVGGR